MQSVSSHCIGLPDANMSTRIYSNLIYFLTSGLGIAAFLYPFWQPLVTNRFVIDGSGANQVRSSDSGFILALLVIICFALFLFEVQNEAANTKTIALLGVLIAVNVTLRFAETAIPGPGGFSPIFLLIILTGYVYGGRIGFLMGALTIFASGLATGGVGPWLPYQMFTAGWVGMSAPLCRYAVDFLSYVSKLPNGQEPKWLSMQRLELFSLALFGSIWGLIYGLIINLWFWPFATGDPSQYWTPGIGIGDIIQRYLAFYMVTSFGWDLLRAVGNFIMILAVGLPVLRGLRRFYARFQFQYQPLEAEHG